MDCTGCTTSIFHFSRVYNSHSCIVVVYLHPNPSPTPMCPTHPPTPTPWPGLTVVIVDTTLSNKFLDMYPHCICKSLCKSDFFCLIYKMCKTEVTSWSVFTIFSLFFQRSRQIQTRRTMLRRNSGPFPQQGPLRIPTNLLKIKTNLLFLCV